MNIENKKLYDLFNAAKPDRADGGHGLYVYGEPGKVTAYATDGRALYKRVFEGANEKTFFAYFSVWKAKTGFVSAAELERMGETCHRCLNADGKFERLFAEERLCGFAVDAAELGRAVKAATVIYKGERNRKRHVALSAHGGRLDVAAWNGDGEHAVWSIDGVDGDGAVMIDSKYLSAVKGRRLSMAFCKGLIVAKGDVEMVLAVRNVGGDDAAGFAEALEYEYREPRKAEPVSETDAPKRARKPAERKARKDFTGWTWNARKLTWTKTCKW